MRTNEQTTLGGVQRGGEGREEDGKDGER